MMFDNETFLHKENRDALRPFEHRAVSKERDLLRQVLWEANKDIRWGSLVKLCLQVMLGLTSCLYSEKAPAWLRMNLVKKLLPVEKELLFQGPRASVMREYICLLVMRKLLGALKQEVGKRLRNIEPMDLQLEEDLIVDFAESEGVDVSETYYLLQHGHFPHSSPSAHTPFEVSNFPVKGGEVLRIHPGKVMSCGCACEFRAKRWETDAAGHLIDITECLRCRKVLSMTSSSKQKKKEEPCKHQGAFWVEGKEGKDAICSKCKEPIADPSTFRWQDSGLEPFGDDPSQDQTILLDSLFPPTEISNAPTDH